MLLLEQLVPTLLSSDARSGPHKILIFSQFKTQLDILESWASEIHDWPVCRIDGQIPHEVRRAQIQSFNTDPSHRIFLLSTRAGGQGINLAAADTVILYDSDWNPQQDLQAQDRAHRIGQTRPVIVYRLATKGTVEQTLLEKADGKRRLEKLVIQKGKFRSLMVGGGDDNNNDDDNLRKILMEDDFEKYEITNGDDNDGNDGSGGSGRLEKLLTPRDLDILTDRSEEAYHRAERELEGKAGDDDYVGGDDGRRHRQGVAKAVFKVVETKAGGDGVLDTISK